MTRIFDLSRQGHPIAVEPPALAGLEPHHRRLIDKLVKTEGGIAWLEIGWTDPLRTSFMGHQAQGEITEEGDTTILVGATKCYAIEPDDPLWRNWNAWIASEDYPDATWDAAAEELRSYFPVPQDAAAR